MTWEPYAAPDGARRYRLVAGRGPDGTPIVFTCDERLMRQIRRTLNRRARERNTRETSHRTH